MRIVIITIILFLGFLNARSQYINISGKAMDIETNQSIKNGLVIVFLDSARIIQTYTDEDGTFVLNIRTNADYTIEISKTGYRKLSQKVSVGKAKSKLVRHMNVYLEPEGIKIKGYVLESSAGLPFVNCKVVLYNMTQKKKKTLRTGVNGEYMFRLTKNQNYALKVDTIIHGKEIPKHQFTTTGVKADADVYKNFQIELQASSFKKMMDSAKKWQSINDSILNVKKDTVALLAIWPKPEPIKPNKKSVKNKKEVLTNVKIDKKKNALKAPSKDTENNTFEKSKTETSVVDTIKMAEINEMKNQDKQRIVSLDSVVSREEVKKTLSIEEYNKMSKEGTLDGFVSPQSHDQLIDTGKLAQIYVRDNTIYYPAGKAVLNQAAIDFLVENANEFKKLSEKKMLIEIFSDANKELAIKDYICRLRSEEIVKNIINAGIPFDKLIVSIVGNKVLANHCKPGTACTEAQHQENRRSRITFTADEIVTPKN